MRFLFGRRRGQALVMVGLALTAMFGLMGLLVDFGYAFFLEKAMQSAADAAALGAVKRVYDDATGSALTAYRCTGPYATCAATPVECPAATGNLQVACMYAAQNGFDPSVNTSQRVTVQASDDITAPTVVDTSCGGDPIDYAPTAPCAGVVYWVTVRVAQTVPQLFSAVLGNGMGLVSARATAAVVRTVDVGSLILINRENEPWVGTTGSNLELGGSPVVNVPGGIILASSHDHAGYIQGGGEVYTSFTNVRNPDGDVYLGSSSAHWDEPINHLGDGPIFQDPTRGFNQPPLNAARQATLPLIPVPAGVGERGQLSSAVCGGVCPPGIYYTVGPPDALGQTPATGAQIEIASDVVFGGGTNFNDNEYIFFGGLNIRNVRVDFGPGKYVLAGVSVPEGPQLVSAFENENRAYITGGDGTDAGRLFISTASQYIDVVDGQTVDYLATARSRIPNRTWTELHFGQTVVKAGNNEASGIFLYGIDPTNDEVKAAGIPQYFAFNDPKPGELPPRSILFWQDRNNSVVQYDMSIDDVDTSCGDINNPCTTGIPASDPRELEIWSTPNMLLEGIMYQPRGAYTQFWSSGVYSGPLKIISGGMRIQGTDELTLTGVPIPIINFLPALIE